MPRNSRLRELQISTASHRCSSLGELDGRIRDRIGSEMRSEVILPSGRHGSDVRQGRPVQTHQLGELHQNPVVRRNTPAGSTRLPGAFAPERTRWRIARRPQVRYDRHQDPPRSERRARPRFGRCATVRPRRPQSLLPAVSMHNHALPVRPRCSQPRVP
jgi:hypothetical protein